MYIKKWKAALFQLLASEIGARIGRAFTDDSMTLVEAAEQTGFKQKGFVGSILERLSTGLAIGPAKITPIPRGTLGPARTEGAVRRVANAGPPLWLFIDDLDKNFENTRLQRARIASFFDAARDLVRLVSDLRLRVAIRPNVWTAIKLEYESLSHVEQYVHNLAWTEHHCRGLLAKRIEGIFAVPINGP